MGRQGQKQRKGHLKVSNEANTWEVRWFGRGPLEILRDHTLLDFEKQRQRHFSVINSWFHVGNIH